ncbi:MAG: queuosine precursor transporter [Candidatus Azobacteroides sp.]|nr:queuosine precursor transporter [Candidatus Azobacteroides sp.]
MDKKVSALFMVCGILFNVTLLISNILAIKIISVGGITATAGLMVFPITYILNDCIAEVWGFKKARLIIWTGFISNFLAVLFYQLAVAVPAASFWEHQDSFASILSQTPRVAIGSLLAFLVGSFLNAYVMSRMKVSSGGKHFSVRAIVSTLIGETADSMIFFLVVFVTVLPLSEVMIMVFTQAFMKSAYEVVILPVTTRVVKYIKRVENVDVYDENISYNVLKLKEI